MPFQDINVKQSKPFSLTGQASPLSLSFDASVAANSTIVVVGCAISSTDQAVLIGTPSGGGATWGNVTNTRSAGAGLPNVFAAVGVNTTAGTPAFSVPLTLNGTPATNFRFSGVLLEIERTTPISPVDTIVTGTSSAASSTSTAATGTLDQTDNLLILCAGGWFGIPQNPAGWTSRHNVQNGAFIGCQVSTREVTSTDSVTGTIVHDVDPNVEASAVLLVLKAADDAAYFYEFVFPATGTGSLPGSTANIKAIVARNRDPFTSGTYEYYSSLTSESGTAPGDETGRRLLISTGIPNDVSLSDTLRASFESSDASVASVGWVPGTVKAV